VSPSPRRPRDSSSSRPYPVSGVSGPSWESSSADPASPSSSPQRRGREDGADELATSELRFRRLAENLRDAVVEYAPEGRITYLSPGLRELLRDAELRSHVGGSPHAGIAERVHPDDQKQVLDAVAARSELTAPQTLEFRLRVGDGSWRWVEARTNPYTLPTGERRVLSILRDVTDHRQALARARRQEEILRIFVRNAPAAVAMLDRELRYLLYSERWCVDYRLGEDDLTGLHHYEVFPEITPRWKDALQRGLAGEVLRAQEDRFERRDGSVDWVTWEVRPWVDAEGGIGGILLLTEVVTEQIRQRQQRERLEARIRQAQRLESLEVLAGGVAHDFNNLLVAILGNVALARDEMASAAVAADLDAVEEAAQRAAELSRQLLAFAGRGRFAAEPVDLNAVARHALAAVRDAMGSCVELEERLASGLPPVEGDASQLEQVTLELVRNAVEALGGTGHIRVSTLLEAESEGGDREASASDATWAGGRAPPGSGPFAVLEVLDDGPGMDLATAERVFEPFFTTKFAGRGLGLAAALGIVHAHGGGLQIWSAPGAGTRVRTVLPLAAEVSWPDDPAGPVVRPRRAPGGVLVVDDEALVRSLLRRALEAEGFGVTEAASGDEALEILGAAGSPPGLDAVLLDLTMPGRDGGAVLREIRARHPDLPVALMSGYAVEDALRPLRGQPPDAFLEKPFRPGDVLGVLRRMLGAAPSR